MTSKMVKFRKFKTEMDTTFWAKFAELKIDELKLDEKSKIHLWGSFNLNEYVDDEYFNPLTLNYTSFNENLDTTSHNLEVARYGYMINTNTYEGFKNIQHQEFIDTMGKCIIDSIIDGTALQEPWRLLVFFVLAYADLKKYQFHYWVAHPTPLTLPEIYFVEPPKYLYTEFTHNEMDLLQTGFFLLDAKSKNFFTVFVSEKGINFDDLSKGVEHAKLNNSNSKQEGDKMYFGFYDPCKSMEEPGWPLRNLLCLLLWHCPTYCLTHNIKVLAIRNRFEEDMRAAIFTLKIKEDTDMESIRKAISEDHLVGWETNKDGKMGPNIDNLRDISPGILSDAAINLNLKLMKWRLIPDLNLEKISALRCLLLGAGTLGCSVARILLGWGIENITFVDSAKVSFTNPVRQSLYTYKDAMYRYNKASAAQRALRKIRPNMNVGAEILHIPMPGHVVSESMMDGTRNAVRTLLDLIRQHDVVFLLLDSREARWLPTLLCAAMNKIAINAALGFDSYTVQRHGTRNLSDSVTPNLTIQNPAGQDLGCYFCNDITQPGNSQIDRTLDQQCTVTRPGLSQIAAGLAVELLMAIIQHPEGISARAFMNNDSNDCQANVNSPLTTLLGGIPHTIRGSLWNYEMKLTVTHRFPSCTACSIPLIKEYKNRGFDFILDACNVPNYLEKLSGLEEILKRPDLEELCCTMDSSSEDEEAKTTI